MDPNATLKRILELVEEIHSTDNPNYLANRAPELAEAVEALDEWLSRGGFLPTRWISA